MGALTRNDIFKAMGDYYGKDKVLRTSTFRTLSSKSAVLAACKGLGINDDEAHVIADLIPLERGANWSLEDCFNGNEEKDRKPVAQFVTMVKAHDDKRLKDVLFDLEGVITGRGIHASAQYVFNAPYVTQNAMMRSPKGIKTTAFNMADSDKLGGLKMDLLVIEAIDKMMATINLLLVDGVIEDKGSFKANYDEYLHPSKIDYDDPKIWEIIAEGSIPDLFQCNTDVGRQAMSKIRPVTVQQMASANSLMRLMPQPGEMSPIDIYVAYKNDISLWYQEMHLAGLSKSEVEVLEPLLLPEYGVAAVQETMMQLAMDPKIAGFDMKEANLLRKAVAKKKPKLIEEAKNLFFTKGKEQGTSERMLHYVWDKQISRQLGYSFSINHTTPYSIIAIQEASLASRFGPEYWGAATMTVNAGGDEENNRNVDYSKIARAVNELKQSGMKIGIPDINKARMSFYPDTQTGEVLFSLKAIRGVGEEAVASIIRNRPYTSFDEFVRKTEGFVKPNNLMQLIKAGAFDRLDKRTRPELMEHYLMNGGGGSGGPKCLKKLTVKHLDEIIGLVGNMDEFTGTQMKITKYAEYVKSQDPVIEGETAGKTWYYIRDDNMDEGFFYDVFASYLKPDKDYQRYLDGYTIVKKSMFDKTVKKLIDQTFGALINDPKILELVNRNRTKVFMDEKCPGNTSQWEMDALLFYDGPHELADIDREFYHVDNFNTLPTAPVVSSTVKTKGFEYSRYELTRIAGTVLSKDTTGHKITLLTPDGIVVAKFSKQDFVEYNRRLSEDMPNGKSIIVENSWFLRGNKLLLTGYRRDDQFVVKTYTTNLLKGKVSLINDIDDNGHLLLKTERG